jgi:hypothetical protein
MKDIIFHIGFPKCASTTLQNKVFINETGYLGTAKTMPNNLAKKLQKISPVGPSITLSKTNTKQWAEDIRNFANQHCPDANNLISSSEMYANRNIFQERPIIPFLKYLSNHIWTEGEVKIVIIIRNQFDKIASEYAQVSYTNIKASQSDFEKQVSTHIQKNGQHLNYAVWVKELYQAFSKKNVCVLLMEDIQNERFWLDLKNFCKLESFEVSSMLTEDSNSNSRKSSKNIWKLREFNAELKARVNVNNYFGLLWPQSLAKGIRSSIDLKMKNFLVRHYSKQVRTLEKNRDQEIILTNNLKSKIVDHYKSSNAELSKLLNRDLSKLGYY